LVEETNRYCHQHLGTLDEGQSPLPDGTVQEKHLFLAIILQMGHNQDTLERLLVDTRTVVRGVLLGIWWIVTDSATYLDSCIFMTIQKTLTRHHSY